MRIYYWKITIQKNLSIKNDIALQLLQISFMFNLIEDSWILLSASTYKLLWYLLWLNYMKTAPHKYAVRKKKYMDILWYYTKTWQVEEFVG